MKQNKLDAWSTLLLELYRLAHEAPLTEFQMRALEVVRTGLGFDSALWGTGVVTPQGVVVHSLYLFRQPPEMIENYERIKQHDTLSIEAFGNLGQTLNVAMSDPHWRARVHPEMLAHIQRYGMENTLSTTVADPLSGLWSAISFYRSDTHRPFTEAQRRFKQNLMPHLIETLTIKRFDYVRNGGGKTPKQTLAICDRHGILHYAEPGFPVAMTSEWPEWPGVRLPAALIDKLFMRESHSHSGQALVITLAPLNDMWLLSLRKKSKIDLLSARELQVAKYFAQGMTYREISKKLHISPVTVRNHLRAIYAKLEINNKAEMVHFLLESGMESSESITGKA